MSADRWWNEAARTSGVLAARLTWFAIGAVGSPVEGPSGRELAGANAHAGSPQGPAGVEGGIERD